MGENLLVNNKNWKKIPLIPVIFLAIVLFLTAWLYVFNTFVLEKKLDSLNVSIDDLERDIRKTREDWKIKVYELLESHKNDILKYERNSDIVKYMKHLEDISRKYWLTFSGFSISGWEIKSEITVRKLGLKWWSEAYEKVKDFIKNYREDSDSLLELKFINSFEWMDEIKFLVNFKTKNILKKEVSKEETKENDNLNDKNKGNE